jgi:hypothetical protein
MLDVADESDDNRAWYGNEEDGSVGRVRVSKMKALTVKMERVTLIGRGR